MIRHPFRLDALGEVAQALQIFKIGRRGRGDRQRNAVHHHRITLADPFENTERLAARQHVILADHLEPVDRRMAVQNLVIVLRAQAQSKAEKRRLGRQRPRVRKRRRRRQWRFAYDVHSISAPGLPEPGPVDRSYHENMGPAHGRAHQLCGRRVRTV
jgi:hypothetical protein